MYINRYDPEKDLQKIGEVNHFNKFFNSVKKRQLKKQKCEEIPSKVVKRNDEVVENNTSQERISAGNSDSKDDKSISENFTIIGQHSFSKINKVKPVLPKWLSEPQLIPTDFSQVSSDLPKFNNLILLSLNENDVSQLFPVQQVVVPWIMKQTEKSNLLNSKYLSRDTCVSSPTGSGKTLAYVLPIIQGLLHRLVPRIRCLVVVPVQELAEQVANVFRNYVKTTNLRVEAITGGKAPLRVEQNRLLKKIKGQEESYESLVDILVITPGRLVEHLQKTKGFNLKYLKYLVIDEADRMMDGIQNDWLFYLEKHLDQGIFSSLSLNNLNKKRTVFQKLLFSATLSQDPEKLKKLNLFQPVLFTSVVNTVNKLNEEDSTSGNVTGTNDHVGKFTMPSELEEFYIVVESYLKPLVIAELLSTYKWRMVLCFCKSASEANTLSKLITILCPKKKVKDISSLLNKSSRNLALKQFSNGEIDMLVSSDVMARGIDVPKVKYVISYDPPKYLRGYVHRAGRTGRAGSKGTVLTLSTPAQIIPLTQKLKEANRLNVHEMKMNPEIFQKRSKNFKIALQKLKECAQQKPENNKIPPLKRSRNSKRKLKKKK